MIKVVNVLQATNRGKCFLFSTGKNMMPVEMDHDLESEFMLNTAGNNIVVEVIIKMSM